MTRHKSKVPAREPLRRTRALCLDAFLLLLVLVGSDTTACRSRTDADVVLRDAWQAYVARFIQADGRVIDYRGGQISTSEGQAYAMLRAVWIGDRLTFDRTLAWARNNLERNIRPDHLWAWKWGKTPDGAWRVLDRAFASDAEEDAALALILAARAWGEPPYLAQALDIVSDLWEHGTLLVRGRRFLLGGDTLCQGATCRLNPSYYEPYAYRIFSKHDPGRDWMALVDTSYFLLDEDVRMTSTGLPTDWVLLHTDTGALSLGSEEDSRYSYDAFRVHWRLALDAALFGESRARSFLERSLAWPRDRWRREQKLPAAVSRDGGAAAAYESLEMIAGLLPALAGSAPDVAESMNHRLQATFKGGVWADQDNYYLQNWAWFGTALYHRRLGPFELK